MKIRVSCPFCVIPAIFFSPYIQNVAIQKISQNVAIHFLYQVQLINREDLFIYLFICLFSIFCFFSFNKELIFM